MAAAVHGACSSSISNPRQSHQSSNFSSAPGGGDCLASAYHQHQSQSQTNTTPMYPTMPKYTRHSPQALATPSHLHVYPGNNGGAGHKYNSPIPPPVVNYMSAMGSASQQHAVHQPSYSTMHRISSASGGNAADGCRNYWNHTQQAATMMYRNGRHHSKRKSAVELLAETKPFYIKSDTVLERLQQSNYRNGSSGKRGRNNIEVRERDELRCSGSFRDGGLSGEVERRFTPPTHQLHRDNVRSTGMHVHHHHHHSHHMHMGSRHMTSSGGSNLLQNKLRMLLNNETGPRERGSVIGSRLGESRYRYDFSGDTCNTELSTSVAPYGHEEDDTSRIAPPSFMSPEPFDATYNYCGETSSGDEPLVLTENYRPISPPAEYAAESTQPNNEQRSRYNYQRSYSHSHEVATDSAAAAYNINSHKSLPDLHAQTSRHSPHSEILSCCSRGNRSIKSAGESSLNRDSGGSSGHYTHRSEPCYRQQQQQQQQQLQQHDNGHTIAGYSNQTCCNSTTPMEFRRDSGSSTQHSANSYCGYSSPSYPIRNIGDCTECHCRTTPQLASGDFLFNFTTPEVPEAFQDDYTPPSPSVAKYKMDEPRYSSSSSHQLLTAQVAYPSGGIKHSPQSSIAQSPCSVPSMEDISPPPIQFKRQKCIRFKNRSRISLPSAGPHTSVANDTVAVDGNYQKSSDQPQAFVFPKCFSADGYTAQEKMQPYGLREPAVGSITAYSLSDLDGHTRDVDGLLELEKFFDRLGLNDDQFHEIYSNAKKRRKTESNSDDSSTVFFSDVSTVDSMRLPDSTETQPQTTQAYRPTEPPSIVERNARIIKWLCNCRKLQYT